MRCRSCGRSIADKPLRPEGEMSGYCVECEFGKPDRVLMPGLSPETLAILSQPLGSPTIYVTADGRRQYCSPIGRGMDTAQAGE